ncbi:uncharacterized protein V6R79_002591 [Siganus canaliculatus]
MKTMILCAALLMTHWCLGLNGAAADSVVGLERIEKCGIRCSQGLQCKTKPRYLFPPPCQKAGEDLSTSSVFHNISFTTVMRCEGKQKCSLHLRVKTVLQLHDSIHGVSICTVMAGMMANCQSLSFTRVSREKLSGMQVELENDCTTVFPSQRVSVTVETVPSVCGLTWTGIYEAPGCASGDLRKHVPECITGRLSYEDSKQKKELSIHVSDMLENQDYHLRLCRKDFICVGTGAHTLIKKEETVKIATLAYDRPLPCLCIEGWSAVMDAPRVQVCPFKDRIEELWFGVSFNPLEGALSWKPPCPVTAVVTLCQNRDDGICVDLPDASQNVSRQKIVFNEVDPDPRLCMKFMVGIQTWIRCPFADSRLQAWEIITPVINSGHEDLKILSQVTATFSVALCKKTEGSVACDSIEPAQVVHVEKNKAAVLNVTGELCGSCLQLTRRDVKFAPTVLHCLDRCDHSLAVSPVVSGRVSWNFIWILAPVCVCLAGVILVTLALHFLLTVFKNRERKRKSGCTSGKQADPSIDCLDPILQAKPVCLGGVLVLDSPQCGNAEKANLISD